MQGIEAHCIGCNPDIFAPSLLKHRNKFHTIKRLDEVYQGIIYCKPVVFEVLVFFVFVAGYNIGEGSWKRLLSTVHSQQKLSPPHTHTPRGMIQ